MLESITSVEAPVAVARQTIIPTDVSNLISPNIPLSTEGQTRHQKILAAAANIMADPVSLYEVPAMPAEYYPPGDERRNRPRMPTENVTFRPVWSEIEDPEALERWAKQSGLENFEDLYEGIPYREVLNTLRPVPKIERAIWTKVHEGKVRMGLVLEAMRGYQVSQMLAEESYRNGMDLLKRHLPEFVPQEPSVVFGDPSFNKDKRENGEYFGKVDGKHVLIIRTPPNPYLRLENYRPVDNAGSLVPIIGAHELMHQRHVEVAGGQLGFEPPEGSPLTIEYIRTHSPDQIGDLVREEAAKMELPVKKNYGQQFALDVALAEGIATSAELFIDFAEARRLVRLGKKDEAKMFLDAGKIRRKMLKDSRGVAEGLHYAVGTEEIVEALFRTMSIQELGVFLGNVDLSKAAKIQYQTKEFDEILKDPRKLPQKNK